MGAEQFVDVTCRGLEVGKSLKLHDFGPTTAFLEAAAPVPVGSPLEIRTDSGLTIGARVLRVQEQVAGAEMPPGMRVAVDLGGKAKGWWAENVSRDDPTIPEPLRRPSGAGVPAYVEDDAVPTATAVEVTIPSAPVAFEPASDGGARRPPPTRTQIMSVAEVQAAIEAGGQRLEDSDGTPRAEMEAMPTDQVGAEESKGNGEADDAGGSGSRSRGKKKKRR